MNTFTRRLAFTITELLVVIAIIVLLMAIAVPTFSSMLKSSERSLAENQLKGAIAAARDAAIQSETGDGAAVFFFTPNGRISVVPCVSMGRLPIQDEDQDPTALPREVFVAVPNSQPLLLPRGWSVRGLAPVGTVFDTGVYGVTQREDWYRSYFAGPREDQARRTEWVFPETGFYSTEATQVNARDLRDASGARRRSFMVRFKRGSGELDVSNRDSALVFDPVPSTEFRTGRPYGTYRADQLRLETIVAPNAATFVRRLLANPQFARGTPALNRDLWALLGNRSPDTVLTRPVSELALYQEQHLVSGIKCRGLNRFTGSLYGGDPDQTGAEIGVPWKPCIDPEVISTAGISDATELNDRISRWIEGREDNTVQGPYDARIFTLTRYLGQTQEVMP